jgi:hypothetical protein
MIAVARSCKFIRRRQGMDTATFPWLGAVAALRLVHVARFPVAFAAGGHVAQASARINKTFPKVKSPYSLLFELYVLSCKLLRAALSVRRALQERDKRVVRPVAQSNRFHAPFPLDFMHVDITRSQFVQDR